MSRSKSSRQSDKKSKRKKKNSGQVPFAGRIIQSWRRMDELDQRSAGLEGVFGEDTPEVNKIQKQWAEEACRFESLLTRAYEGGAFKRTISSIEHQMLAGPQSNANGALDWIRLMEDMAGFHKDPEYILHTTQGEEIIARTAIYGVPVLGNREHLREMAADPKLTSLQRATGFVPIQSNVISMGLMTAGDALMLAHNPLKVWELARHTFIEQAQIPAGSYQVEGLMQKSVGGADLAPKGEITVGGYVILMAVFSLGEQPIEAVDGPEEFVIDAWLKAKKDYEDGRSDFIGYMDVPCELADAARMAISMQLMQTIQLAHAMDNPHVEAARPRDAAFIHSDGVNSLDLVARFDDGSQVRIPEAIPAETTPFLADIADGMEIPTTLTTDTDLNQWHALLDSAGNEEALEIQDAPVARMPRSRMH